MSISYPYSYQLVAQKLQDRDLLLEGPVTLLRMSTPHGPQELAADLPWALARYKWMLPFLLCLERHGREDCMCWKEGKKGSVAAYVGWRKTEKLLLLSNPSLKEAWVREKRRALGNYSKIHGIPPMADSTIPWAGEMLALVRTGRTPCGAMKILGRPRHCVTSARQKHPWLNAILTELGYPAREWKAQFPPERRTR